MATTLCLLAVIGLLLCGYVKADSAGEMYCYGNQSKPQSCSNGMGDPPNSEFAACWSSWGDCSTACGGGHKWRCRCDSCSIDEHRSFDEEYGGCSNNCNNGEYNATCNCCDCCDEYYGLCCDKDCSVPKYCVARSSNKSYWCDEDDDNDYCVPPSSCCHQCENTTTTYKAYHLDPTDHQCKQRCNWLDHYCWPGTCDESKYYLATTCKCLSGFQLEHVDESGEKSECKLTHPPDIETCRIGAESPNGEAANSTFSTNSTACSSTEDAHINFEIHRMFFEFSFKFELPEDPPNEEDRHDFISGFNFGIIDAYDTVNLYRAKGEKSLITEIALSSDASVICSIKNFSTVNPWPGLVTCCLDMEYNIPEMLDGEKVCHNFEAKASGFVLIQDMAKPEQQPERHEYDTLTEDKEVCFHTDFTSPDHCLSSDAACEKDVLNFGQRIRRNNDLLISFDGWFDPEPESTVSYASGIKGYEIQIRDVLYTPVELFADFKNIAEYTVTSDERPEIFLPNRNEPSMYAIYLWALDSTQEGPNYRIARRFVLVDNTSVVVTNESQPMIITSASKDTNYEWQTVLHYIKLDWKHHFANSWHKHTNLLLPIRSEGNLTIIDHFEQETGELPVSGTPNIDGIVNFQYKFQRIAVHKEVNHQFKTAPQEELQILTLTEFSPEDGDIVHITIKAVDIMNNTLNENITIKIDSSAPFVEDMYLAKDGYRHVYVHNSTDLSEMDMTFRAYDPHSGLKSVFWKLGTHSGMANIGTGTLPVVKEINNVSCSSYCYCPAIGPCEAFNYSIPLSGLMWNNTNIGDHNREYHFTFELINEANLQTIDNVVILVDSSPPEKGHVFDGKSGERDRDFQSEPLLSWYWTGFIDHESGISKYHAAVGLSCFTKSELQFLHEHEPVNVTGLVYFRSTQDTSLNFVVNETGKYHLTVIAFNGAFEPSDAVCSSGLTYDTTSPDLRNISLIGSVHQKKIVCSDEKIWFLSDTGSLQSLSPVAECIEKCINISLDYEKFPQNSLQNGTEAPPLDDETSILMCSTFDSYLPGEPIFLISDIFHVIWDILEEDIQMLDYFVGIASNEFAIEEPDLIGFVSTHNTTNYKCIHCGIGQGESVFITLKAVNKALLSELIAVGPIIIDMTPPVYRGNMTVTIGDDDVMFSWKFNTFVDADYEGLLTEYEWSIRTPSTKEPVVEWTKHIFPDNIQKHSKLFMIKYPKHLLQLYDQDHGWTYAFVLKCFNKAMLYREIESEEFVIHTKILPSAGVVQHVDVANFTNRGIGFQESIQELCITWYGFEHHQEKLKIFASIGSFPYSSDVVPVTNVSDLNIYCFKNLSLERNATYYAMVVAINGQGITNSSSKGIFIANATQLVKYASISYGDRCPADFDYIIKDEPSLENTLIFNKTSPISSNIFWTIHLQLESTDASSKDNIFLHYCGITKTAESWSVDNRSLSLYFNVIQATQEIVFEIVLLQQMVISKVAMHPCLKTSNVQAVSSMLYITWSFETHFINYIDDYLVTLKRDNRMLPPTNDSVVSYRSGKINKLVLPYSYKQDQAYAVCIQPCFQQSCIKESACSHLFIDRKPPTYAQIKAFLDSNKVELQWRDSNIYALTAEWELFKESGSNQTVTVYDWSISNCSDGSGLLLNWQRLFLAGYSGSYYLLKENVTLQTYKYKDMYFILRTVNSAGVPLIASTFIELRDLEPPTGVNVFDMSPDYHLDKLKDFLHSSNLGPVSKELHNNDVDYSSNPSTISAAVSGCSCDSYTWTLQTDESSNCLIEDQPDCIATKVSSENVITFKRQKFVYGIQYVVCVHSEENCASFKKCSNGFIYDNLPPIAGTVYMVDNLQETTLIEDVAYIAWESFTDVEVVVNNSNIFGINIYQVSIGTFPDEEDIVHFTSTGVSNHAVFSNIPFVSGTFYRATVKACDNVGLCTSAHSEALLFDDSPPVIGKVSLKLLSQLKQDSNGFIARWQSPQDKDSGIRSVFVALGTTEYSSDVSGYMVAAQDEFIFDQKYLLDGHKYFAHVKVINNVGLWNMRASNPIWYDSTPPEGGYVRHGSVGENYSYTKKDTEITLHWGGFFDPHSGIINCHVAVGTAPLTISKQRWKNIGLRSEISIKMNLHHGRPYLAVVECCNGAMLCSKAVSKPLIVDISRPIPGVIHVGDSDEHECYQYNRNSLLIKWNGFIDMESDIQMYQWCISTLNSSCDIVELSNAFTETHIRPHNLSLPLHTPLFATITAYNYVGLSTQALSKEFIIDNSPPYVVQRPTLITPSSLLDNTQYDGSYISVSWNITDDQIPMKSFEVSIQSHHDGVVPLTNLFVGVVNEVTIALSLDQDQHLRDGNIYSVKVIGCNAAGFCCASSTNDFLVDSSSALLGGFIEPMHWRKEKDHDILSLSWTGFVDPHSNIRKYFLMVGASYSDSDMSGGIVEVNHDDSHSEQHYEMVIKGKTLPVGELIYLTIWAQNGVGLLTVSAKTSVFVMPGGKSEGTKNGQLLIQKHSCDIHYCNHDCTCAQVNGYCVPDGPKLKCQEQNETNVDSLQIYYEHINTDLLLTPSTQCLAAHWVADDSSRTPVRYEWSVSMADHEPGFGIFDTTAEKYIFDSDLIKYAVYCLPRNKSLLQGEKYIYHVRVWHSFDEYTHYTSDRVTIDGTAPTIGMGRHVKDHDSYMMDEVDFRIDVDGLYASWKNVFSDQESGIHHYEVLFGTSQGGNEIFGPLDVGLSTNISVTSVTLQMGYHYYTTVYAYNHLGMVTYDFSDGFVVDLEAPIAGTCYTGLGFLDKQYFSSSTISFSWNGFTDSHSYIKNYLYMVKDTNDLNNNNSMSFIPLFLQNQITLSGDFKHGHTYEVFLKARDGADHESPTIKSKEIHIDSTPPIALECDMVVSAEKYDMICNCSSEKYHFATPCICDVFENVTVIGDKLYRITVEANSNPSGVRMRLEFGNSFEWIAFERHNASYFTFQTDYISNNEENIQPVIYTDNEYSAKLTVVLEECEYKEIALDIQILRQVNENSLMISIPVYDLESGIASISVGLGSNIGGFQHLPITEMTSEKSQIFVIRPEHGVSVHPTVLVTNNAGLRSTLYFPKLLIDWTGPKIGNVNAKVSGQEGAVDVLLTWHVDDAESVVTDCDWAIGKVLGHSDILDWQQTQTLESATATEMVNVHHGDVIYFSIQCWNNINLNSKIVSSEAVDVVLKPSDINGAVIIPELDQSSIYPPVGDTQANRDIAAFSYYGFGDPTMIQYYEYKIPGDNTGVWLNAGKQDFIILESLNLEAVNTLSVRAVNAEGHPSDPVEHALYTDTRSPALSGDPLVWYMHNDTMSLSWENVFTWETSEGDVYYELYVGSGQGASDLVTGLLTKDSQITLVSKYFAVQGTCFIAVTAIVNSGLHETYTELIYLH